MKQKSADGKPFIASNLFPHNIHELSLPNCLAKTIIHIFENGKTREFL